MAIKYSYADILTDKKKAPLKMCKNPPQPPVLDSEALLSSHIVLKKIEPTAKAPASENGTGFIPDSLYFERRINKEAQSFESNAHRTSLQKAADMFRFMMTKLFPLIGVFLTGSFAAGVDLQGSDLDFSLTMDNEENWSLGTLLRDIRDKIQDARFTTFEGDLHPHQAFGHFKVIGGRVPVLRLIHLSTLVSIDVTINNDTPKRNTQLLVWYGQIDSRFPILCRVVKRWAEHNKMQSAFDGKLNAFSLCLLVIHFLQCRVKILPNIQEVFPELNGEFEVKDDDYWKRNLKEEMLGRGLKIGGDCDHVGVGVLFVAFLKYWSSFDFTNKWISIRQGKAIRKRRHNDGYALDGMPESSRLICIEDPFMKKPWNCAGSVWDYKTFIRMKTEFRHSYRRILKEKTIFTNGQVSEWRHQIELDGRQRDLQTEKWMKEIEMRQLKTGKKEGSFKTNEWNPPSLFSRYNPRIYWEECVRKERGKELPWPEAQRVFVM